MVAPPWYVSTEYERAACAIQASIHMVDRSFIRARGSRVYTYELRVIKVARVVRSCGAGSVDELARQHADARLLSSIRPCRGEWRVERVDLGSGLLA
jgi:hypothetical protein